MLAVPTLQQLWEASTSFLFCWLRIIHVLLKTSFILNAAHVWQRERDASNCCTGSSSAMLATARPPLRPYQDAIVSSAIKLMRTHSVTPAADADADRDVAHSALLYLPTGGGKTRVATAIVEQLLQERPGARVWFLVNRNALVLQAAAAFEDAGIAVGFIKAGMAEDASRSVQIASIQSVARRLGAVADGPVSRRRSAGSRSEDGEADVQDDNDAPSTTGARASGGAGPAAVARGSLPRVDLLIVDEAHAAVSPSYLQLFERFGVRVGQGSGGAAGGGGGGGRSSGPRAGAAAAPFVLGLTATPIRLQREESLCAVFHALIRGPSVSALIGQGVLVPPRVFDVSLPEEAAVSKAGKAGKAGKANESSGGGSKGSAGGGSGDRSPSDGHQTLDSLFARMELARAAGSDTVDGSPASTASPQLRHTLACWRRHAAGRRTIVFAADVAHSIALVRAFNEAGVPAAHVDGETPERERQALFARLGGGELLLLSSVGVLSEGFDCPSIACVLLLRPTHSKALYLQQVGRGLRCAPGKRDCVVLDGAGNTLRHGPLTGPVGFEVEWESDDEAAEEGEEEGRGGAVVEGAAARSPLVEVVAIEAAPDVGASAVAPVAAATTAAAASPKLSAAAQPASKPAALAGRVTVGVEGAPQLPQQAALVPSVATSALIAAAGDEADLGDSDSDIDFVDENEEAEDDEEEGEEGEEEEDEDREREEGVAAAAVAPDTGAATGAHGDEVDALAAALGSTLRVSDGAAAAESNVVKSASGSRSTDLSKPVYASERPLPAAASSSRSVTIVGAPSPVPSGETSVATSVARGADVLPSAAAAAASSPGTGTGCLLVRVYRRDASTAAAAAGAVARKRVSGEGAGGKGAAAASSAASGYRGKGTRFVPKAWTCRVEGCGAVNHIGCRSCQACAAVKPLSTREFVPPGKGGGGGSGSGGAGSTGGSSTRGPGGGGGGGALRPGSGAASWASGGGSSGQSWLPRGAAPTATSAAAATAASAPIASALALLRGQAAAGSGGGAGAGGSISGAASVVAAAAAGTAATAGAPASGPIRPAAFIIPKRAPAASAAAPSAAPSVTLQAAAGAAAPLPPQARPATAGAMSSAPAAAASAAAVAPAGGALRPLPGFGSSAVASLSGGSSAAGQAADTGYSSASRTGPPPSAAAGAHSNPFASEAFSQAAARLVSCVRRMDS